MADRVELVSYPDVDGRLCILRVGSEVDGIFVRTRNFCALIDTLSTPALCREALDLLQEDIGERPLLVVNTHMDWDHFWGNAAVARRAPIIAHRNALDRFSDARTRQTLHEKAGQESRFEGIELFAPTITFTGSMILHGGDLTLELLHTPGHTPDHIAVWIPEIATCLAADAVESPIPEVWSEDPGDLAAIRSSLERIRDLKPKFVLPAHGGTISPDVVGQNIAYFSGLQECIGQYATSRLRVEDILALPEVRFEQALINRQHMAKSSEDFYRQCHAKNVRAVARSYLP